MKGFLILLAIALIASPSMAYIQNCYRTSYSFGQERCEQCSSGYYIANNGYNCYSCRVGCNTCSSDSTCSSCNSGYYLTSSSTCYSCVSGCSSCTDGLTCQLCSSGYYKNIASTCTTCISHCSTCSNGTQCISCSMTYKKVTNPDGSDRCDATASTTLMMIAIVVFIICLIPCCICCCCWAAISECLGWGNSQTNHEDGGYSADLDPSFHHSPPAYQQSFPSSPGYQFFPPPPAYNSGMPYQNNSGMPY